MRKLSPQIHLVDPNLIMSKSAFYILRQKLYETTAILFVRLFISLHYLRSYLSFRQCNNSPTKTARTTNQTTNLDTMTPRILGTGRANGTFRYDQAFLADKLVQVHSHLSESEHDKIRSVFEKTGIQSCTSCCPEDLLFQNMGKAKWVEHVKQSHLKMGGEAMEKVRFLHWLACALMKIFCLENLELTKKTLPLIFFFVLVGYCRLGWRP